MPDDNSQKRIGRKTIEGTNGLLKGSKAFHATQGYKYNIKFNPSKSCVVEVIDTTVKSSRRNWVFHLDRPHPGKYNFNHVNINKRFSGLAVDPHLKLPTGGLTAGKGVAKVAKVVNKVALPVAIAVDTVYVGKAVWKDAELGTTRNTVETGASVAGGWVGGSGGAVAGAAIGSAILPGVGTIIGGILGALGGGIGGSIGATALVDTIGDAYDYDIIEKTCETCGVKFKIRRYCTKDNVKFCPDCECQNDNK